MPYRHLRADKITETIDKLTRRITERFGDVGLGKVAAELSQLSKVAEERAAAITRPNVGLRIAVGAGVAAALIAVVALALSIRFRASESDLFGLLQAVEAALQILIFAGAAVFFLISYEDRQKRKGALEHLHELRSIVHVIDMHQLTKDPTALVSIGQDTESSPKRLLSPYELTRYLDYCSELLSLSSKIAAIYSQASRDAVVGAAVNEIEQLTTNISAKIWQKIRLVGEQNAAAAVRPLAEPPKA